MDWLLLLLAGILAAALGFLAWRHAALRRRLREYHTALCLAADEERPLSSLPEDFPGLEDVANAVKTLALAQAVRTSSLEAERARLAAVLEQMTDGVLIADSAGRIQFVNPAAEKLFDAPGALGRSVVEVIRHHKLVETWQRCQQSGKPQEESTELPRQRLFLQLVALPDRQTGGSLLLVHDLTRVRRLESVRRDFISNVSHELRTPLASLKALTETLRDGALEDPQAAPRFLERIETEVDALTQMAQELLDLSRIESGQVALQFDRVVPSRLLETSAERMRAQAERAGLTLTVVETAGLPEVRADRGRLEQVLVNLIHNAVKFTLPGGSVTLSAAADAGAVRFAVHDTGVGIAEEDLERIFERFFKSDRARSGGGTGLGLSISRHIVEAHGGRIWAESQEGRGSDFFFTIPIF
jgi:two-component system phosphate regulon sensor histidine kinase PhoR